MAKLPTGTGISWEWMIAAALAGRRPCPATFKQANANRDELNGLRSAGTLRRPPFGENEVTPLFFPRANYCRSAHSEKQVTTNGRMRLVTNIHCHWIDMILRLSALPSLHNKSHDGADK